MRAALARLCLWWAPVSMVTLRLCSDVAVKLTPNVQPGLSSGYAYTDLAVNLAACGCGFSVACLVWATRGKHQAYGVAGLLVNLLLGIYWGSFRF